ncbi:MAG: hypothetical protein KDB14_26970 [Planctomycetales bacterium]|nr:hypothetical protein [Planctomycetales bacterium]
MTKQIRGQRCVPALLLLLGLMQTGCRSLWPDVAHPGDARSQRSRAVMHDPYPDPALAPTVEGGRPPGFEVPYHEPKKSRVYSDLYSPPGY